MGYERSVEHQSSMELHEDDAELLAALVDSLQDDGGAPGGLNDVHPVENSLGELSVTTAGASEDGELMLNALYAPMLALDDCFPGFNGDNSALLIDPQQPSEVLAAVDERDEIASGGRTKREGERKVKRRSNPNKARQERHLELVMLRSKVSEMEQQLAALRASKESEDSSLARRLSDSAVSVAPPSLLEDAADSPYQGLTETWRQLCMRQLHRRIKAERENTRLKRALEGQLKASSTIRRLLDRPVGITDAELQSTKRLRAMGVPPTDPDADRVIFARLLDEADKSLREIDVVLEENGIFHIDTAFRGAKMRERGGGVSLDVFASSILPFSFKYTASGVWKHYAGTRKHFGSVYEKTTQYLGPNDDTIMENFAMEMISSNRRADFRLRQVVKRCVTAERVVIVWTTDCEPIDFMNERTDFGLHERGYVVCRPPSTGQLNQKGEASRSTVVQVCYRISPYEMAQTSSSSTSSSAMLSASTAVETLNRANIDGIAQFVFSSLDLELKANQEHIESLLLTETVSQRAPALQQTASV